MTKRPLFEKGYKAKETLELVHTDLCGPMNVKAREGMNISSVLLMIIQRMAIFT